MQKITHKKASRFASNLKTLFPGYMFVSVNSELPPWRLIYSLMKMSKLMSFEGKPKPLPLQLISGLLLRCDASGTLHPPKSLSEGGLAPLNADYNSATLTICIRQVLHT